MIKEAIENILKLAEMPFQSTEEENRLYSVEEVFPGAHAGHVLRGLRIREELTQKQLNLLK